MLSLGKPVNTDPLFSCQNTRLVISISIHQSAAKAGKQKLCQVVAKEGMWCGELIAVIKIEVHVEGDREAEICRLLRRWQNQEFKDLQLRRL